MIKVENLSHTYGVENGRPITALREVSLTIEPGEYVAIIGRNGSGKSTLAKHLNALLLPTAGQVTVDGMDTRDLTHIRDIRSRVGMVFQDPDNQIVATVVEEDVAFGPENL
ncbi:MAG: ATP-binding cassette domain-containing protein, partial [Caldilineae bacterium]